MPSLFDQISGFTFPDVLMNSGPLPSTAGGPAGSDGSIDGVINGTSALLGNITPYAFGKSARTGSDRNYQQIPHRYPYIIPKIWLPDFYIDKRHHGVSHAVDQGDIAFLLYGGSRAWWTSKEQFATRAPQCAFAGIDVVNYILACLQASRTDRWGAIRRDLFTNDDELYGAIDRYAQARVTENFDDLLLFHAVRVLVQQYFVPHGICAGSEKQGGQHEHDGGQPVLAPVNFVITMTVDGKNIDLVNYWYGKSMLAGDELIFRLKKEPVNRTFTLSSYYKDPQSQSIDTQNKQCWQLVPDLLRHDPLEKDRDVCTEDNAWRHHQSQGYWRIAQTFQTRAQNNIHAFTRGTPLEVTFAPVWQSFGDCRDASSYGSYQVESQVTHYDDGSGGSGTPLLSLATKDKITFFYGDKEPKQAFQMTSSQNHYTITFDAKVCKVYADGVENVIANGADIQKDAVPCLHVFFDEDATNVFQNHKPHMPRNQKQMSMPVPTPDVGPGSFKDITATSYKYIDTKSYSASNSSGNYHVKLYIRNIVHEPLYDADFLRAYYNSDYQAFAGNWWRREQPNYYQVPETQSVRVEYRQSGLSSSSSSTLTKIPTSGLPSSVTYYVPRKPGYRGAHMDTDLSLTDTAATSDEIHVADGIGALEAQAPAKPQKRMKKIKFFDPEAAATPHTAAE